MHCNHFCKLHHLFELSESRQVITNTAKSSLFSSKSVVSVIEILLRNPTTPNDSGIWPINTSLNDCHSSYATDGNEGTTAAGKVFGFFFYKPWRHQGAALGPKIFVTCIDYAISCHHVRIDWSSRHASMKLYRIVSRDLHVDSPQVSNKCWFVNCIIDCPFNLLTMCSEHMFCHLGWLTTRWSCGY